MNKNETAYRTTTIQVGNVTVNIHQPILTNQERQKREEAVINALRHFGKSIMKN